MITCPCLQRHNYSGQTDTCRLRLCVYLDRQTANKSKAELQKSKARNNKETYSLDETLLLVMGSLESLFDCLFCFTLMQPVGRCMLKPLWFLCGNLLIQVTAGKKAETNGKWNNWPAVFDQQNTYSPGLAIGLWSWWPQQGSGCDRRQLLILE